MKKPKYDKKIIERRDKINKKKLFTMIPIEISNDKSYISKKIIKY